MSSCTSFKHGNKHAAPGYLLEALLVTARTCQRDAEIQCSPGLTFAIAKNRKRRLALHTALRTVIAPSGMLDRAFVIEQQWSSGLDFSNHSSFPVAKLSFVLRMLVRGG